MLRILSVIALMAFLSPLMAQEGQTEAGDVEKPEPMWLSGWAGWGQVSASGNHYFNGQQLDRVTGVKRADGPALGFQFRIDPVVSINAGIHRYEGRGNGTAVTATSLYSAVFAAGTATSTKLKYRNWYVGIGIHPASVSMPELQIGLRANFWQINYIVSGTSPTATPVSDSDSWKVSDLTVFIDVPVRSGRTKMGLSGEASAFPASYLFSLVTNIPEDDGPGGEEGYRGALAAFTLKVSLWWESQLTDALSLRLIGGMQANLHIEYTDDLYLPTRDIPSWVGGWVGAELTVRF